ncbi:MAG: OmpA family protein [Bacteroidota bacterium]
MVKAKNYFNWRLLVFIGVMSCFMSNITQVKAQSERSLWREAEQSITSYDYKNALEIYKTLYEENPENYKYAFKIGYCYLHSEEYNDIELAIKYFKEASDSISKNYKDKFKETQSPPETEYYLGVAYRLQDNFKKAIEHFKTYKSYDNWCLESMSEELIDSEIASCEFNFEYPPDKDLRVKRYSFDIDVPEGQYLRCPVISGNDSVFVYTIGNRNIYPPDININKNLYNFPVDDIYFSTWENGTWTEPVNISSDLELKGSAMPTSISYDGKTLLLVQDDNDDGNIYMSEFIDGKWQPIRKLNKNVNSNKWESHATINSEEDKLYFTSGRKGGHGGMDIYVSEREENNEWGKPKNIGEAINTNLHEETPFLLEEKNQLYFGSESHNNIGGYDMFVSLYDSSSNRWQKPLNLGFPYNTVSNDLAYIVTFHDLFIFCPQNSNKRRPDMSGSECLSLKMPEKEKLMTLKGQIFIPEFDNDMPDDLKIIVVNDLTGDTLSINQPENDGSFVIDNIDPEKVTHVNISSEKIQDQYVEVNVDNKYDEIKYAYDQIEYPMDFHLDASELALNEMKEEEEETKAKETEGDKSTLSLVVDPVFFDFNESNVKAPYEDNLNELANYLKEKSDFKIAIHGHTDHVGPEAYNVRLGRRRANAVKGFLIQQGVGENNIVTKSFGESLPVAKPVSDDEARKFNRRADFYPIDGDFEDVKIASVDVPEKYQQYNSFEDYLAAKEKQIEPYHTQETEGEYLVIGGSFLSPENARKAVSQYENQGFSCAILSADNGFNRVAIKSFDDKKEASQKLDNLRNTTSVENLWILKH